MRRRRRETRVTLAVAREEITETVAEGEQALADEEAQNEMPWAGNIPGEDKVMNLIAGATHTAVSVVGNDENWFTARR